jgi:hypothetical protein
MYNLKLTLSSSRTAARQPPLGSAVRDLSTTILPANSVFHAFPLAILSKKDYKKCKGIHGS